MLFFFPGENYHIERHGKEVSINNEEVWKETTRKKLLFQKSIRKRQKPKNPKRQW